MSTPKYRAPIEFYRKMDSLVADMQRGPRKRFELVGPSKVPSSIDTIIDAPVNAVVSVVNGLMSAIANSPVGRAINSASKHLPYLREQPIPTPFGRVKLPEIKLPEVHEVELDEHKRKVLKATVGIDVAQVFGIVPVVGDLVADVFEDTHAEVLRETLNDAEFRAYTKYDKLGPSTLAIARTFMKRDGGA